MLTQWTNGFLCRLELRPIAVCIRPHFNFSFIYSPSFPSYNACRKWHELPFPAVSAFICSLERKKTEYKMALPWISAEYSQPRIAIPVTNFINGQQLCLHNFRNNVKQIKSITELLVVCRHWNISDLMQNNLKFLVPSPTSPDSSAQVDPNVFYVVPCCRLTMVTRYSKLWILHAI